MRRVLRLSCAAAAVLLAALLIVPLAWPVPPLQGTRDPRDLAGPSSRFIELDGVRVHYVEAGEPNASTTVVLLHGFGASTFSWRDQLELLDDRVRVIAWDRPAFGLTERPLPGSWQGLSPYSPAANVDQLVALMDALGVDQAVLVGHSAGAVTAVSAAVSHPERVAALVLEAPAVREARSVPAPASALMRTPQARRIGPLLVRGIAGERSDEFIRSAYHDQRLVTPEVLDGYRLPLSAMDWDRGLWELLAAPRPGPPASESLDRVRVPVIVVAGDRDTFVAPENSAWAYEQVLKGQSGDPATSGPEWPRATFVEMPEIGHIPHEEAPEQFANEVFRFLDVLTDAGICR